MSTFRRTVFVALAAILAVPGIAQDKGDIRAELKSLRERINTALENQKEVSRDRDAIVADWRGRDIGGDAGVELEKRINALHAEIGQSSGTSVNSVANPIRMFGDMRVRWGYTSNRNFGSGFGGGVVALPGLPGAVPPDPGGGGGGGGPGGGGPTGGGGSDNNDDDGRYGVGRFLLGFDFVFDRNVWTRFSIQADGLMDNGETPGSGLVQGATPAVAGVAGGGNGGLFNDIGLNRIDLYEGFIHVDDMFGRDELSLRAGRQEIVLGNEFQFGNNEFFSGETFDGMHFLWEDDSFDIHFLVLKLSTNGSFNTRDHPYITYGAGDGYDDDELYSLYFTWKGIEDHTIDVYWIYFNGHNGGSLGTLGNPLGAPSTGETTKGGGGFDFYHHTVGLRVSGMFNVADGLDYNVEFAYQFGDLTDGTNLDVEGYAIEAEAGLMLDKENNLRIFVRWLHASGAEGDETGYIPLFPERHSYASDAPGGGRRARYGLMDIIPMSNIFTAQGGVTYDPGQNWTLGLTVLWAQLDEEIFTQDDDELGWEIDLFGEYRHSDDLTLTMGLGVFLPDDGAPLKGGNYAGFDGSDDVAVLFYIDTRVLF